MKRAYGLGAAAIIASVMDNLNALRFIEAMPQPIDTRRPKTRKTGKRYPHSSARQQARYARQIAAGQLKMDGI
jgi:hypothetical protein